MDCSSKRASVLINNGVILFGNIVLTRNSIGWIGRKDNSEIGTWDPPVTVQSNIFSRRRRVREERVTDHAPLFPRFFTFSECQRQLTNSQAISWAHRKLFLWILFHLQHQPTWRWMLVSINNKLLLLVHRHLVALVVVLSLKTFPKSSTNWLSVSWMLLKSSWRRMSTLCTRRSWN